MKTTLGLGDKTIRTAEYVPSNKEDCVLWAHGKKQHVKQEWQCISCLLEYFKGTDFVLKLRQDLYLQRVAEVLLNSWKSRYKKCEINWQNMHLSKSYIIMTPQ